MADRDIIEHLTDEHREVEAMWEQLQQLHAASSPDAAEVARKIVKALTSHDAIELQLLYPALNRAGATELSDHGKDEHTEIRRLLADVDGKDPLDATTWTTLDTIIRKVKAHVEEEETVMFPKLRAAMDQQQLIELGKASEAAEALAPTHPHRATPSGGIGAAVVGSVAGVADRVRDAVTGDR